MADPVLTEEVLQFGEGGRLSGVLTRPSVLSRDPSDLPVFVFFNAGPLHRVGPHGLYVRIARDLSQIGFSSLRVDLAGKGDSGARPGLTKQESIMADFEEILCVLESALGRVPLVLGGLCSGADDAIRLTARDTRVVGLFLLDPVCPRDGGFAARAFVLKYTNIARYIAWLKRRIKALSIPLRARGEEVDPLGIRNVPSWEELRTAFASMRERKGRVLCIFTQYALTYYNQAGQLGRVSDMEGFQQFCTEVFWPQAEHTYALELHRRRVIEAVKTWARGFSSS